LRDVTKETGWRGKAEPGKLAGKLVIIKIQTSVVSLK